MELNGARKRFGRDELGLRGQSWKYEIILRVKLTVELLISSFHVVKQKQYKVSYTKYQGNQDKLSYEL